MAETPQNTHTHTHTPKLESAWAGDDDDWVADLVADELMES